MKRIVNIIILALTFGASGLTSCVADRDFSGGQAGNTGQTAEISFVAGLPAATAVATRGGARSLSENAINDIYVLVFDIGTEQLVSKSKGKELAVASEATNGNVITFKATLPVGTQYTFMVLANAESYLGDINVGAATAKSKSDVLALAVNLAGKWDPSSSAIPMWGEQNLNLTASAKPSFELTRMLARVNVDVNLRNDSQGYPPDNFKLTSVRYYNYNTAGALVPARSNYDFSAKRIVAPTLPATPGTAYGQSLLYSGSDIVDERSCAEKIYVFEARHNGWTYENSGSGDQWIDNACLVIGGSYRTKDGMWLDETFYRVDFIRKESSDPANVRDTWLSVLRNYSYNVSIVEVSGSGFASPDIALRSAPVNLEAKVLEWEEGNMGEIVFDGVFYLSVSRDEVTVLNAEVTTPQEENSVYIKTDYTYLNDENHADSGWHVERYVDAADGTSSVHWLTLDPERGAPHDRVKAHLLFEENQSATNRTAIVWVAAGRLRYPIYVTQRLGSIEIVDPVNGDAPLDELLFEVQTGGTPAQVQHFKVQWKPSSESVAIKQTSPKDWAEFDPGCLDPDPSPSWTLSNPSGEQVYAVTSPNVDQNMIDRDPFYERESTYSFTVGTGNNAETASIRLHQIYYNIVVDVYNYRLNGRTQYLNVRSNTEWKITGIEEWLHNKAPDSSNTPPVLLSLLNTDNLAVGTGGGPKTSGETVSFTVVDQAQPAHQNKWGTVYVTFESPTGKFPPRRVAITFPARGMTLLGLGYARDVRPYNTAWPSTRHNQGVARMLPAAVNFGETPESIVRTAPWTIVGYHCEGTARATPGNDEGDNWYRGAIPQWINKHNPDIIAINWSMYLQADDIGVLRKYLENGGAIMMFYGGTDQPASHLRIAINGLLKVNGVESDFVWQSGSGHTYVLENIDDPILNGPFGSYAGGFWGMHQEHMSIRPGLIEDQVIPLCRRGSRVTSTATTYTDYINVFRHKTLNLFWIVNAQANAAYYPNNGQLLEYDVIANDEDFRPQTKRFGPPGAPASNQYHVINSFVHLNAYAWIMNQTNHTPPPGGYSYNMP